jgi:hypothetical protein
VDDAVERVECADCGYGFGASAGITHEGLTCPECGSERRHIVATLTSTAQVRSRIDTKARREGARKAFLEERSGDDLWRKFGKWMKLTRLVDRDRDRYFEHIEDPETGEVARHVDEPLSQHRGRGSAKPKT